MTNDHTTPQSYLRIEFSTRAGAFATFATFLGLCVLAGIGTAALIGSLA